MCHWLWLSPNLGPTWEDSPFLAFVTVLYVNANKVPDNNFCHSPPRCYSEFMTLIKVCACVSGRLWEQEKQGERGFAIELGVIEFSGMHNPNHLTFKRLLSNCHGLQFG